MALILSLETATHVCSVALCKDGEVIALRESIEHNSHSALITLFVEEVMKEGGYRLEELDAIAVSKGPGSYTGLRIGVSTAKGFCFFRWTNRYLQLKHFKAQQFINHSLIRSARKMFYWHP